MKKQTILLLLLLDLLAIALLILITYICLQVKDFALDNYLSSLNNTLYALLKTFPIGNLALLLVPIYAVVYTWAVFKLCRTQSKRLKTVVINSLIVCAVGIIFLGIVYIIGMNGTPLPSILRFLPSLFTYFVAFIVCATAIQILIAALFRPKKN